MEASEQQKVQAAIDKMVSDKLKTKRESFLKFWKAYYEGKQISLDGTYTFTPFENFMLESLASMEVNMMFQTKIIKNEVKQLLNEFIQKANDSAE